MWIIQDRQEHQFTSGNLSGEMVIFVTRTAFQSARPRKRFFAKMCAPILYIFLFFSHFFFAKHPLSFPIPPTRGYRCRYAWTEKEGRETNREGRKRGGCSKMHSLPHPGENVSGSQQTTRWATGWDEPKRGELVDSIRAAELFRIPLLFIIMFDRNIAFGGTHVHSARHVDSGVKLWFARNVAHDDQRFLSRE